MDDDPAPLDTLVSPGLVTATTARLWLRCPAPGPVWVRLGDEGSGRPIFEGRVALESPPGADATASLVLPADLAGLGPLRPNTDYVVTVEHPATGTRVGHARFRTSPLGVDDAPDELTIAVASCNQPFDDDGNPSDRARALARHLPVALRRMDACRVLLLGDQMYSDMPESMSLFDDAYFRTIAPKGRSSILDCSREEVRRIYQSRYRQYLKLPEMQELLSGWAGDARPDDHEIVDNFGASPDHATARYRNLRDGALDAFYDYQAQRYLPRGDAGRPAAFDHAFVHGPVAFFAADLRSEKHADGERTRMMSDRQFAAIERFLRENGDRHVVVLVLSLPLEHVPDWIVTAIATVAGEDSDAADRWSYAKASADRDRLVRLLFAHQVAHPRQRIVVVGGDVHVGLAARFTWKGAPRPVSQLVSSALTNVHLPWLERLAEKLPFGCRNVCEIDGVPVEGEALPGVDGLDRNPVGALNFGTLHVRRVARDESTVRLRLHSLVDQPGGGEVQCVYDSGEL